MQLLAGSTAKAAAETAGVDESTVRRWVREDVGFRSELEQARSEVRALSVTLLAGTEEGSVRTLIELRDDKSTPPSVRLAASVKLLERSESAGAAADMDKRLGEIEGMLDRLVNPRRVA